MQVNIIDNDTFKIWKNLNFQFNLLKKITTKRKICACKSAYNVELSVNTNYFIKPLQSEVHSVRDKKLCIYKYRLTMKNEKFSQKSTGKTF